MRAVGVLVVLWAGAAGSWAAGSCAAGAQVAGPRATANGVVVEGPALTLRVDALRADVLRVRVYPNGRPAEDASWAVLPEARTARVQVTAEASGFRTSALRVTVGADLRLTVSDLAGHVLQSDAVPVRWGAMGSG